MRKLLLSLPLLVAAGCASAPSVDLEEPRRLVGTQNQVRVDVQVFGDQLAPTSRIPLKYDITNERSYAIAVADLVPEVTYDPDTQTVTVGVGSEVPGHELLPRLIAIPPGQKRSFDTVARIHLAVSNVATPVTRFPNALRLKLSFLADVAPFQSLIGISERAVHDPQLADRLFPLWLEKNETVYTNSVPMTWQRAQPNPEVFGSRRRGGRGF